MQIRAISPYKPAFGNQVNNTITFYEPEGPSGYLANVYVSPFELDGKTWLSVEHYFQAQKFAGSAIDWLTDIIRNAPTPLLAKKLARLDELQKYRRADWSFVKTEVMRKAVMAKFMQQPDLKAKLLATGNAVLQEDHDPEWGIGKDGKGENKAGKILMAVREVLRKAAI